MWNTALEGISIIFFNKIEIRIYFTELIIIIIIINSTYKAQNLPKNSGRTKNKKNTQELWIMKSLTEQMGFQMSLELQEISDVTKTAWKRVANSWGSKMKFWIIFCFFFFFLIFLICFINVCLIKLFFLVRNLTSFPWNHWFFFLFKPGYQHW